MLWPYRLQQRLALTGAESAAILLACGALVAGLAIRQLQAGAAPPAAELYAADARFAALDRAAPASDTVALEVTVASPVLAGLTPGEGAPLLDDPGGAPAPAGPVADAPPRRTRQADPAPGSINLNTAGAADLQRLRGIGPALAGRIVEYRRQHGPFRRIEDVERVKGIGPRLRERIAPFVRL